MIITSYLLLTKPLAILYLFNEWIAVELLSYLYTAHNRYSICILYFHLSRVRLDKMVDGVYLLVPAS